MIFSIFGIYYDMKYFQNESRLVNPTTICSKFSNKFEFYVVAESASASYQTVANWTKKQYQKIHTPHIATTSIALFKEMLFLFYLIAMFRFNNLKNCVQVILKPSQEGKQSLSMVSRGVANAVSELVQSAEAIKGKHDIFVHFLFLFIQLFKGYI